MKKQIRSNKVKISNLIQNIFKITNINNNKNKK